VTRADQPLPTGVVTLLLTDVEGSTRAWQAAPDEMVGLIANHYEILDKVIAEHGGVRPQEQGEGDSVVAAFSDPVAAVTAAVAAQVELRSRVPEVPVRMALHTGPATLRNDANYAGLTIIRCARIRSCGHGGQILLSADTAAATRDALPDSLGLVDLGLYGLKGLDGRERIWQLTDVRLPADFPPLNAGASATGNLPVPISSFIGRRRELAAVGDELAVHRLVMLTGDVGLGKTRLAIAAAAAVADSMPGGVWWIPLADAPADDADTVAAWMLHSCALPRPLADPAEALIEHFGSVARSLVVVDGVDRASGAAATVIDRLLSHCPEMHVLGTGIEPLRIPGEVVLSVPPMAMPATDGSVDGGDHYDIDSLHRFDATRLFIERAMAGSGRSFDDVDAVHVANLCRDLRGAPLAIELAAARVGSTPIAELARSLGALVDDDAPVDLARTLASSIEWTYQLLDADAQLGLRRLGIFRGDIEIDAATAVVRGGDLDDRATATALRRLFEQQLLTFDDVTGRVSMSAAVRAFARDRLSESNDRDTVTTRHGSWFAGVAERFGTESIGGRDGTGAALPISLLAPDEGDVVAALHASMASDDPTVAYRILIALGATWSSIGRPDIGEQAARWLCTRSPGDGEELWAAAVARSCQERSGDPGSPIHPFADEALAIAELVGDEVTRRVFADLRTQPGRSPGGDVGNVHRAELHTIHGAA
jgi:predicted ATPase/class 3 adenylate cyclase